MSPRPSHLRRGAAVLLQIATRGQVAPNGLYDTKDTISNVAWELLGVDTGGMQPTGKRTMQVNVKMTGEDFSLLQKAAHAYWPDAVLSNSGIVLGLAKIAARGILKPGSKRRRSQLS